MKKAQKKPKEAIGREQIIKWVRTLLNKANFTLEQEDQD